MPSTRSLLTLVAAAALALPAAADASYTSTIVAGVPVMTGDDAGDALLIDDAGGNLRHNRAGDPGFAGAFDFDSSAPGDQTVPANVAAITIDAGGGDDLVTVVATAVGATTAHGQAGDDVISTSNGADHLFGDAGDDRTTGGKGNDEMTGGDGNDLMFWNNGDNNDKIDGEANTDEVEVNGSATQGDVFTIKPNGARVRFDRTNLIPFNLDIGSTERLTVNGGGGADTTTGEPGLAPLILLTLNGGPAADTITGGDGPDLITGGDAADALGGAGGDDRIFGNRGDDTMAGDDGDDALVWNNGDNSDKMDGGNGSDRIEVNGSPTAGDAFAHHTNVDRVKFERTNLVPFSLDIGSAEALFVNGLGGDDSFTVDAGVATLLGLVIDAGSGNDTIAARDQAPTQVRCGDGNDTVTADALQVDDVNPDCEAVDRTPPDAPPDTTATAVVIGGGGVRLTGKLRRARAPISVTCPATETGGCTGRLTLVTAGRLRIGRVRIPVVLGGAKFALTPGQTAKVNVKLPSTLKRLLGRGHRLKARVNALTKDLAGNLGFSSARVTLRAPARWGR